MKDILSLLKSLENPLSKSEVVHLADAAETDFSLSDLLLLTLNTEHPAAAFRASWVLETIVINDYIKFSPYSYHFLEIFHKQTNPSCQRHFTRITALCLESMEVKEDINLQDRIIETTFDWLTGNTPVAVKANCIDILYLLRHGKTWIEEELKAQIEFLMREGSPAIQSRGKKFLRRLKP